MLLIKSSRMSGSGYTESLKHPQESSQWLKRSMRAAVCHSSALPATLKITTMPTLFTCGAWLSMSVLLYGSAAFTLNISTQDLPTNLTAAQDEEDIEWDSQFLQLRANLMSSAQPLHPYTLLTNAEDYSYLPKPRHRRLSRLQRLLGPSFDPFWMSIEMPSEESGSHSDGPPSRGDSLQGRAAEKFNLSVSPELREASASLVQKLEMEAADVDLGFLPSEAASAVRDWLVRSASCGLSSQWIDLGPAFWPRWLRQTDCEKLDGERSCSFPSGMECVRAQTTNLKILAWHCLEVKEKGIKADRPDGSTGTGTAQVLHRCLWRQVPYPVVTGCTCSCKRT